MYFNIDRNFRVRFYGFVKKTEGYWHPGRTRPEHILTFLTEGSVDMQIGQEIFHVQKKDAFLVPANTFYRPLKSEGCSYFVFHFSAEPVPNAGNGNWPLIDTVLPKGQFAYSYLGFSEAPSVIQIDFLNHAQQSQQIWPLMERIYRLRIFQVQREKLMLDALFREACILLSNENAPEEKNETLQQMIQYIRDHICQSLSLSSLSREFRVSPSYIARLFRENLHMPSAEYIHRAKMAEACSMLINSEDSIGDISAALSYDNPYYFTRLFHRYVGVTPTAYRRGIGEFKQGYF